MFSNSPLNLNFSWIQKNKKCKAKTIIQFQFIFQSHQAVSIFILTSPYLAPSTFFFSLHLSPTWLCLPSPSLPSTSWHNLLVILHLSLIHHHPPALVSSFPLFSVYWLSSISTLSLDAGVPPETLTIYFMHRYCSNHYVPPADCLLLCVELFWRMMGWRMEAAPVSTTCTGDYMRCTPRESNRMLNNFFQNKL